MRKDFSGLTEAYLRSAEEIFASIPLGVNSIPLDQVYVMLETVTSPKLSPQELRPDLPAVPERQEHAGLLDLHKALPSPPPLPLSKVLAATLHLSLLGEPGSGKSTTLQFIGLCFARPGWARTKLAVNEPGVPVLVKLGENGDLLKGTKTRLLDDVVMPIVRGLLPAGTTESETNAVVMDWLALGRLVLLLDGLDEAPGEEIKQKITLFASDPNGRKCRIVLSSRPAGYSSPGSEFLEYRIKPFDKPEEVQSYLRGWLTTLRPEWEPQAEKKAHDLLDKMNQNSTLKRITDNPLLLRLTAESYATDEEIARNRADLYHRYVETVAWQRRKGTRQPPPEQQAVALTTLETFAWKLQQGSKIIWNDNDPQHMLLRQQLGFLVIYNDAGKTYFTFSHTTFREYFIARHLAKAWLQKDSRVRAWAILRPRLHIPAWREPLLLLAGMLEKDTVTDLVHRVLNAHSRYEKVLRRDQRLAATMVIERGEENVTASLSKEMRRRFPINLDLQHQPIPTLLQALEFEDKYIRGAAAIALGKIGDPQAVPALLHALKDEDGYVRGEAALALGKIGDPQVVPALLQALKDEDEGVRGEAALALGKIGDPQAVPALLQALKDEDKGVRWNAVQALGEIGPPAVPALLQTMKDKDSYVRGEAAEALGKISDPQAVPALLQALKNEGSYVRGEAINILGEIGNPQAGSALHPTMDEANERSKVVHALGEIGAPAVPALLQALKDEDESVRGGAAEALGEIGDPQAVPALLQALEEASNVHGEAIKALEEISDPQAVPALLQTLKDANNERSKAVQALGEIGNPQAVPALLQTLEIGNSFVREDAVEALGKIGDPQVVPALLKALDDDDSYIVRGRAAEALGKIGDPQAVPNLLQILKDEDSYVRADAIKSLGMIGDPQAVPALLQALKDEDVYVRWGAAEALGEIGDPQAVPALQQALKEKDLSIRLETVKALDKIGAPAVPALLQALKDKHLSVRMDTVKALEKIGGQITDIPTLKNIVTSLRRAREWNEMITVTNHLENLQVSQHSLPDSPLIEPPVPSWKRSLTRFSLGAFWALVLVILGLVLLLSTVLGDLLKTQWKTTLQAWATAHPGELIGFVIVVLLIGGLLTLAVEALKESLKRR